MDIPVMIKLYGLRMSNYYSLTKALLIEGVAIVIYTRYQSVSS